LERKPSLIAKVVKVHKVGGSLMIILPLEFTKAYSINEGDEISVIANHIVHVGVYPALEAKTVVD